MNSVINSLQNSCLDLSKAYLMYAQTAMAGGRFEIAVRILQQALELCPDHSSEFQFYMDLSKLIATNRPIAPDDFLTLWQRLEPGENTDMYMIRDRFKMLIGFHPDSRIRRELEVCLTLLN